MGESRVLVHFEPRPQPTLRFQHDSANTADFDSNANGQPRGRGSPDPSERVEKNAPGNVGGPGRILR